MEALLVEKGLRTAPAEQLSDVEGLAISQTGWPGTGRHNGMGKALLATQAP